MPTKNVQFDARTTVPQWLPIFTLRLCSSTLLCLQHSMAAAVYSFAICRPAADAQWKSTKSRTEITSRKLHNKPHNLEVLTLGTKLCSRSEHRKTNRKVETENCEMIWTEIRYTMRIVCWSDRIWFYSLHWVDSCCRHSVLSLIRLSPILHGHCPCGLCCAQRLTHTHERSHRCDYTIGVTGYTIRVPNGSNSTGILTSPIRR